MTHFRTLTALGCLLAAAAPLTAQEWPRFRGPNGSGLGAGADVPARWADKDYRWKVKLAGSGHSSPVLWGDRLFVTSADERRGKRLVQCLRAEDGSQLWAREYPAARHGMHKDNSLASSTPAADRHRVYVTWADPKEYVVLALDHDGNEAWRADLGPFKAGHGFGASPIVHDDLLVVPNDQDGQSSLVGLDSATGKVRWKVPRKGRNSYSTPCVFHPEGKPAELIFTNYEHGVTSLDPKTGRVNWERDVFAKGHVESAIASPVVAGDLILASCGWLGVRYDVVALRPYAKASPVAYTLERQAPLVPTPLAAEGLLFLWNDRGIVTCADPATGKTHWSERVPGTYYGSPVCAGGRLYAVSREGDVAVVAAAREFDLLAVNALGEGSHSTPAVAGGRLYLRTFTHLVCVGGKR